MPTSPHELVINAFTMNASATCRPGSGGTRGTRAGATSTSTTGSSWPNARARHASTRVFFADVLGIYDVYGGSRDAAVRARHPGPGQRPAAADPGDGGGHRGPRLRRHRIGLLRASLPLRPADVDARPPHRRPHRLERRHLLPQQRRAQPRASAPGRPRPPLRHRRRVPRGLLQALGGQLGGRRGDRAMPPRGVYTDPSKVHPIDHEGEFFTVPGIHLSEPSPQRTPVHLPGRRLASRDAVRRASTPRRSSSPRRARLCSPGRSQR